MSSFFFLLQFYNCMTEQNFQLNQYEIQLVENKQKQKF